MWEAFFADEVEKVRALVRSGADTNDFYTDDWGVHTGTPVSWAIVRRDTAMAKMLIAEGAAVPAETEGGYIPFDQARGLNDLELMQMMLDAGVDVNYVSNYEWNTGWTPLMYEMSSKNTNHELVRFLIDAGADVNAKSIRKIEIIVSEGYMMIESGATALSIARELDKQDMVDLLIASGATE